MECIDFVSSFSTEIPPSNFVYFRTQGTLSDILRCPRPWSELKSGRQTYIKMLRWLEMSEEEKFEVLHGLFPDFLSQ